MTGFLGSGFVYAVESTTRKYKPWLVAYVIADDAWYCSCPARSECKHVRQAKKAHEAGAAERSRLTVVRGGP